jgi:succinate-semialdehyde dehydrogenase / glutarate-semialdehyde dehydrogenase
MTQVDQVVSGLLTDLYIGGTAIPAAAGGRFDVLDPAAGTVIASVADGGVEDAIAAIGAAFDLTTAQREELATLLALENRKALVDARAEVSYAAEFFLPRGRARLHRVALPGAQLVR